MWQLLMEMVLLLAVAFLLGAVFQWFRQSAIIGYLLAGALVGPLLFNAEVVGQVAGLGVALLLFSIGLEFSFSRLKQLGGIALLGGTMQVGATLILFALAAVLFINLSAAVAVGAMAALSSTAVVLRVLVDRSAIDSVHGRNALGILLLQDVAVVPLVLLVTILTQGGTGVQIVTHIAKTLGGAIVLIMAFYGVFYHLVPRILMTRDLFANRELVVLLTIIVALGAIWSAHAIGLSPALGAFLAGMLLAESPFATQIRSDIGSIRTLFVTLFFASVGMLADPQWFIRHPHWVFIGLALVVFGKTLIVYLIARMFKQSPSHALATGFTLAQIGEFSFVLAAAAREGGLISADLFALVISVTILSMFLTPYLVINAEQWSLFISRHLFAARWRHRKPTQAHQPATEGHVLIIGFGPAGQQVAQVIGHQNVHAHVIELNPRSAAKAREMGLHVHMGDATSSDVLNHVGLKSICAVIVTLPDPKTCQNVIANINLLIPGIPIMVRSRYHRHVADMHKVGARIVVDEENTVGEALGRELVNLLHEPEQAAMACALAGRKPSQIPS